tara:strand:+ start:5874 stop:6098 length:225 start_codon:yes stop_codon:yes gene_type:complete
MPSIFGNLSADFSLINDKLFSAKPKTESILFIIKFEYEIRGRKLIEIDVAIACSDNVKRIVDRFDAKGKKNLAK